MKNSIKVFGFILSSALVAAACGSDDTSSTAATTTATSVSTASTTTGGGNGGAGGAAVQSSCDTYCASIMANCTAANAQYSDAATCLASCAGLPEGLASDMAGNTVGCRIYHAGAAKADAKTHCEHAGPGGAGVCGADCEGFCAIAKNSCSTKYATPAACETECKAFKDTVPFNAAATSGDSLACRLYHLTAATVTPAVHCDHITAASAPCK